MILTTRKYGLKRFIKPLLDAFIVKSNGQVIGIEVDSLPITYIPYYDFNSAGDPSALIAPDGGIALRGYAAGRQLTASSSPSHGDNGTLIIADHASVPIVLTIPLDVNGLWRDGDQLSAYMRGVALVSFAAASGVTIHQPVGLPTAVQYGIIAAIRVGVNEWTLS